MNKGLIIGLLAVVIIGGGLLLANPSDDSDTGKNENEVAMEAEDKEVEAMMEGEGHDGDDEDNDKMMKDDSADGSASSDNYVAYNAANLSKAQNEGDAVIFFAADWCPTCQAAKEEFRSSLDDIPDGVTILEADYDEEKELKKKYGVTSQDTFIQVDAAGEKVSVWNSGGKAIDSLVANLK